MQVCNTKETEPNEHRVSKRWLATKQIHKHSQSGYVFGHMIAASKQMHDARMQMDKQTGKD